VKMKIFFPKSLVLSKGYLFLFWLFVDKPLLNSKTEYSSVNSTATVGTRIPRIELRMTPMHTVTPQKVRLNINSARMIETMIRRAVSSLSDPETFFMFSESFPDKNWLRANLAGMMLTMIPQAPIRTLP